MRILASFVTATILTLGFGALPGSSIARAQSDSNTVSLRAGQIQALTLILGSNKTYPLAPSGGTLYPIDTSTVRSNFGPAHDQNFTVEDLAFALQDISTVRKLGYSGPGNVCPVMSDNPTWARYSFEVTFGTLPDGLNLGCDGVLNGTPTVVGVSDVYVRVCGDFPFSCTGTSIRIQVKESGSFQWNQANGYPGNGNVLESGWGIGSTLPPLGAALNSYVTKNGGQTASFTCEGSLAPGLACDSVDGAIGTVTSLGTYFFRLVAHLGSESDAITAKINVCLNQSGCTEAQAATDSAAAGPPDVLVDVPLVSGPSPKVGGGSNPSQDMLSGDSAGSVGSGVSGCTGLMGVSCNTNSQTNDAPAPSITAGTTANSRVATIPTGVTSATIPATSFIPATTMRFSGSAPTSVTVAPVAVNPAPASVTPFIISSTTKIVDISISGTITAPVTVCLDGASTDHLFHYTGGAWVELRSQSFDSVNHQVCGVTDSFSPFAAAPPAPIALVNVPVPDPLQQSKITALSVSTAIAGSSTPVVISGSFVETIKSIHINGVALASGSWTQTPTTVSFTMPGKSTGTYQIQLFNGSAPVLALQTFTFTSPSVVVAPTSTPTAKPKVTYIRCVKPGKGTRIAYGVNPVCPVGYVKK